MKEHSAMRILGSTLLFLLALQPMLHTSPVLAATSVDRNAYYGGDRFVVTTYFYWYRSAGPNFANSPHCMEWWTNVSLETVRNMSDDFPSGWPGPTVPEEMIVNATTEGGWHDSCSRHPPAAPPQFNATGHLNESSLLNGSFDQFIPYWFDWMNATWHEWEFRCMMRAGIDVLIPVYWFNGMPYNYWAYEGLQTMVAAWHDLAQKVTDEANLADGGNRTIAYGREELPKIAMFFDTTCMRQLWMDTLIAIDNEDQIDFWKSDDGPDLTELYWKESFWERIKDFYDVLGTNGTADFLWNGNTSLVWLYSGGWFSDVGTDVLDYCKEKFAARYNRSLVFIGGGEWKQAGVDGVCPWGACFEPRVPRAQGIPAGAVGPGYYNLGAVAGQGPLFRVRDASRYVAEWRAVMKDAVFVHVETWNELHEGTDIAWSQEHGFQWIDLTRQMTDEFHAMAGKFPAYRVDEMGLIVGFSLLGGLIAVSITIFKLKPGKIEISPKRKRDF